MKKFAGVLFLILFSSGSLFAQFPFDTSYACTHYNKYEYMIPMRDGIKLFTAVYVPKDTTK
ncbi:MAG: hypothetical protein ACRDE2_10715, partial [Chitinophagaceae bacterium]